ncbi:DUF1992 domain-containing protein [Desulfobotulus sp.]|jgi:hypothetical protein|uniref:DnaJ family domain-containing protein n=1 Tax=Desulfobotulus sp. TaxID=1940337 RepID=UPI002A3689FE|nr:DUF1992 domain-containing protein [Desulfobotulus sp.]MDY0162090.1 DUF1992 domain-containing protein [Desulfobotulus sp.]
MLFDKIAEEKILEAQKRGLFSNLPGSGAPLPPEDIPIPEDLRMAYRMLKSADFLPPELELRKEIHSTRELLEAVPEIANKQKILTKLNVMIRKLNILQPARLDREMPEYYLPQILERLENQNPENTDGIP